MRRRCRDPKRKEYSDYGGRGIRVCDRWEKFENFLTDMGERPSKGHTISRKDNDGEYCKRNCRWETVAVQNRNKRSIVWISFRGARRKLIDWATLLGVPRGRLYQRYRKGLPPRQILKEFAQAA